MSMTIHRGYWEYKVFNLNERNMKTITDCKPTILERNSVMSWENEIITKQDIKERCKCVNRELCLAILDKLQGWEWKVAEELLNTLQKTC